MRQGCGSKIRLHSTLEFQNIKEEKQNYSKHLLQTLESLVITFRWAIL